MDLRHYDHLLKIVCIGDSGVGKKSLQHRYVDDTFPDYYVQVDLKIKRLSLDGKSVKLQIWNNYGGGRFKHITPVNLRGTHGLVLVYDVTNQESFENISQWLGKLPSATDKHFSKLLVGNKCDLTSERVVDYDTAKVYADQLGIPLIETSAKDATNVEQAFVTMAAQIMKTRDLISNPVLSYQDYLDISERNRQSNRKSCY